MTWASKPSRNTIAPQMIAVTIWKRLIARSSMSCPTSSTSDGCAPLPSPSPSRAGETGGAGIAGSLGQSATRAQARSLARPARRALLEVIEAVRDAAVEVDHVTDSEQVHVRDKDGR